MGNPGLTSGGDAPGMNAAIRAIVRSAINYKQTVYGISGGYQGLSESSEGSKFKKLDTEDVKHVLDSGGTFLKSSRYPQFKEDVTRVKALRNLKSKDIHFLIVVGGDGSFKGANALYETNCKHSIIPGLRIMCIPASIDNDIPFTKYSIGADTALQTAVGCIDKIRTTAYSHKRAFLIQVMGRDCDYLPLMTGISSGASVVLTPQEPAKIEAISEGIDDAFRGGREFVIIIVSEGLQKLIVSENETIDVRERRNARPSVVDIILDQIKPGVREDCRPVVLGHVQRGGSPSYFDRILATRFAVASVKFYLQKVNSDDKYDKPLMVALQNEGATEDKIVTVPLSDVLEELEKLEKTPHTHKIYQFLYKVVDRVLLSDKEEWPDHL